MKTIGNEKIMIKIFPLRISVRANRTIVFYFLEYFFVLKQRFAVFEASFYKLDLCYLRYFKKRVLVKLLQSIFTNFHNDFLANFKTVFTCNKQFICQIPKTIEGWFSISEELLDFESKCAFICLAIEKNFQIQDLIFALRLT